MILTAKYIIYQDFRDREFAILFPPAIQHAEFDDAYNGGGFLKKVSAGITIISGKIICSGDSDTLNLKGRGEVDAEIIEKTFAV